MKPSQRSEAADQTMRSEQADQVYRCRVISQHHQHYLVLPEESEEPVLAMLSG